MVKTQSKTNKTFSGIERCTRYAFMPNQLNFCGPNNRDDILEYYSNINKGHDKNSIKPLLEQFETMYPYLKFIAKESGIKDPFNERVVDAYWLGNNLIDNISTRKYYNYLINDFDLEKKVGKSTLRNTEDRFLSHAIPHHNFHALNIFRHTGKSKGIMVANVFDKCRISSATVESVDGNVLKVQRKIILVDKVGNLYETELKNDEISNNFENITLVSNLKKGDIISMHWGAVCEKISGRQKNYLENTTKHCIEIYNGSSPL